MENGAEIYRRFRNGDDSALVQLVELYKNGLMLYLCGFVGNIHTAEDLTEDCFLKLALKKPQFKGESGFKTWLYAIAGNLARDYLRKARRIADKPVEDYAEIAADEADIEQRFLREERKLAVHGALKQLNSDYRQALYLVYFADFSNREAAQIMKKSVHAFENLLSRARKSLKNQLEKEGFTYENI